MKSVAISDNGLTVAIGTLNGSIGLLDITTQGYQTILRSHTNTINAVAMDPHHHECATVSICLSTHFFNRFQKIIL